MGVKFANALEHMLLWLQHLRKGKMLNV
jgi:hypothetical protein